MSERTFNQMSEIEPIVLQLCAFIYDVEYNAEFPYAYFRGDKEAVIKKALEKIKQTLETTR
jgi:hypothetical protein